MAWEEENQHLKRWDERNKGKGWDYDDVREEFSDYFEEKDPSDFTADDWNDLELEFDRVITMLNKGEKSGKMPKSRYYEDEDGGWWGKDGDKEKGVKKKKGKGRKYEKAYETALYTAGEGRGKKGKPGSTRGGRGGKGGRGDDMTDTEIVVCTALITAATCFIIFSFVLCCIRKRANDTTQQESGLTELSQGTPSNGVRGPSDSATHGLNNNVSGLGGAPVA